MTQPAVLTLTAHGQSLGARIVQAVGGEVVPVEGAVREKLAELFEAGRPLVCVMALGIVVRILGPLARNKETDPPVVVVDEAGQFAVSVLGGHVAGANELARQVARAIGALPVITTASDVLGLPPLDLVGRQWGWKIERGENLKPVAAALVRGETIGVHQVVGRRDWWQAFSNGWPASFQVLKAWPPAGHWPGLIVISDAFVPAADLWPVVVYRPPSLVLGVGCRRGVSADEIEALFRQVFPPRSWSPLSVGLAATVSLKSAEPGLVEFTRRLGVPLRSFSTEELARVADLPTPSERVREKIGIAGVAEPSAMLAAGATTLVVPKVKSTRVTMALARREDA